MRIATICLLAGCLMSVSCERNPRANAAPEKAAAAERDHYQDVVGGRLKDFDHRFDGLDARAKGLSERAVLFGHALRNGLIPVITVFGLQAGMLLAGAFVTETIFSWPGLGRLTIQAINARDYPLVQGCILVIAITYILINLMTDLLYSVVDPRIRYE